MSNQSTDSSDDDLVIVIMGEDADGDGHIFTTSSPARAMERYLSMAAVMGNVRVNIGFEELVRLNGGRTN